MNAKNKNAIMNSVKQFVKFGIVGVSNTAISLIIYYALVYVNVNYILANTIGFIVSVLNAYYWNNKYVFKKETSSNVSAFIKSFVCYGTTFMISTVLLIVMVKYLNISELIAPIINLIITVPLNFFMNKFWTFK